MTQTLTALYDDYGDASKAVAKLETLGIPHSGISIVGNNEGDRHSGLVGSGETVHGDHEAAKDGAASGAGTGATVGTVIGGAGGLLAGLGLLAIPGVGPVVAAGWLVATLTGAGVGAAVGGLGGGLAGAGVGEHDAHAYSEGVRRGGTLVTARVEEAHVPAAIDVMEEHGSVDLGQRTESWKADGWEAPSVADHGPSTTGAIPGRDRVRSYPAAGSTL